MATEPTFEQYQDFEAQHGYTVTNALEVYIERMRETATQAEGFGAVFNEAADTAQRALDAWRNITDPELPTS